MMSLFIKFLSKKIAILLIVFAHMMCAHDMRIRAKIISIDELPSNDNAKNFKKKECYLTTSGGFSFSQKHYDKGILMSEASSSESQAYKNVELHLDSKMLFVFIGASLNPVALFWNCLRINYQPCSAESTSK